MAKKNATEKVSEKWTRQSISQQPTPGTLERNFRSDLGALNPHLCLADTAIRRMAKELRAHSEPKKYLHTAATEYHPRLYTDHLDFQISCIYLSISQVALIISRLNYLCILLQRHHLVRPKLREVAQGDFIQKTLFLLIQSRTSAAIEQPLSSQIIEAHLDPIALSLMDYYRSIRNIQLHGQSLVVDSADGSSPENNGLNVERIISKFGSAPSDPDKFSFKDVLLCSKAAQSISKSLCRAVIDMSIELAPELIRRFGHSAPQRRQHAASRCLRQEFLLDEGEVSRVLSEMSWLA